MMDLEGMRLLAGDDGSLTFDIYSVEMKVDKDFCLRCLRTIQDDDDDVK